MMIKERLSKQMNKNGYVIGCFDSRLNYISEYTFKKIVNAMFYGSCDIPITIHKEKFILEVNHVDDEIDFSIISKKDYHDRYGEQ